MRVLLLLAGLAACERSPTRPVKHDGGPRPVDAAPVVPVDVVIALDMSKSMEETDLPPDRLGAAQDALRRFVATTDHARIGLVIFGQRPELRSAPTEDRQLLDRTIGTLRIGDVPELGTAIGDALALAVDQVRATKARHAVILLADGDSNWITRYSPQDAAEAAKAAGVPVHTVLVGSDQSDMFGMATDPKLLQDLAATTGGTFHRGTTPAALDRALVEIRETVTR